MKSIQLKRAEYISILANGQKLYGGNQMLFPKESWWQKNERLRSYGCGVIAMGDLALYLAGQQMQKTPVTEIAGNPDALSWDRYSEYVQYLEHKYLWLIPKFGIPGAGLVVALFRYFRRFKLPYRVSYPLFPGKCRMLKLIIEMLKEDIPVIMAVGPNFPIFWGKHGVLFYQKDADGNYVESGNKTVRAHFVVITGVEQLGTTPDGGRDYMLQLSSWGKCFYLKYSELRRYIRKHSNGFASGIIRVRPKM